jgi:transposase-like protein
MDALRVNIRDEGHVSKKAVYLALGRKERAFRDVNRTDGGSEVLDGVLNELKNRGMRDTLIAAVDGLTGFPAAINAVFPETDV